ncbi:MAG TPA: CPBP family intramembrane metalloprotease [candidate division Zixibacteria bacterium]|nr:CPBP family intramembrane metalloprotease [candidate division Zixibacteria bacterium]
MHTQNSNNKYVIDPEPMINARQAVLLVLFVFILSNIATLILAHFFGIHTISFMVEIGVFLMPVVILAAHVKYPFDDFVRPKNFLRIDLNLITIFNTIFLVIIAAMLLEFVQRYLPFSEEQMEMRRELLMPGGDVPFIVVFLSVAVIPGICEEALFRGVIQPSLIKRFGPYAGIAVTALLFAAAHAQIQAFISLFILGIFLGIIAFRGGTFLYAVVSHTIFNGIAVIVAKIAETEGVEVQDGGFSISLGIVLLTIFIVLMVMLFRLTPKRRVGEPDMYHI